MSDASQSALLPSSWTDRQLTAMVGWERLGHGQRPAALDSALARYLAGLQAATSDNEFIDVRLGGLLVSALRTLVQDEAGLEPHACTWVRMTVAYLLVTDDVSNDHSAIDGLDDDAEVVLGLLDAIHRPDLAQPIRAHLRR